MKTLTITLNYDLGEKRGVWGVVAADTEVVNLLDVAEALSWAVFDTVVRIKQMQPKKEEDESKKKESRRGTKTRSQGPEG